MEVRKKRVRSSAAWFPLSTAILCVLPWANPSPVPAQELERPRVSDPILVTGDRLDLPHSEAHLALDPTDPDHMIAASIVFPDSADARVDAYVTFDGGQTWGRRLLPLAQGLHAFDPWTAIDPDGQPRITILGRVGRGRGSWLYAGRDGGRSWATPFQLPMGEPRSQDQGKMTIDTTQSEWSGRIYYAIDQWGRPTTSGESTDGLTFYRIDEPATPPPPVARRVNNLHKTAFRPLIASDGSIVQLFEAWARIRDAEQRTNLMWSMHSVDGGRSFNTPSLVTLDGTQAWSDAAIAPNGPHEDRVYASWYREVEGGGREIVVAHSDDLGQRWSEPSLVHEVEVGREAFFQRIDTDGLGSVAVTWVEHVPVTDQRECHEWFVSISRDGGESFSDPTPLAPRGCNELPGDAVYIDGVGNLDPVLPRFARGGEYHGIVGLPDGGFRVLFPLPREGVLPLWLVEVTVQ